MFAQQCSVSICLFSTALLWEWVINAITRNLAIDISVPAPNLSSLVVWCCCFLFHPHQLFMTHQKYIIENLVHIYLPTVAVYLVWLRPGLNHPPLPTIVQMNCQIIGSWEWHRREHVCCRLCIGCSVVHCCNFTSSFWGQQRGKAGESDTIHVKQTNYTVIELDRDGWLGHTTT